MWEKVCCPRCYEEKDNKHIIQCKKQMFIIGVRKKEKEKNKAKI